MRPLPPPCCSMPRDQLRSMRQPRTWLRIARRSCTGLLQRASIPPGTGRHQTSTCRNFLGDEKAGDGCGPHRSDGCDLSRIRIPAAGSIQISHWTHPAPGGRLSAMVVTRALCCAVRQRLDMLFPSLSAPLPNDVSTGLLAAGFTPFLHAISMTQGGHVHAQLHRP